MFAQFIESDGRWAFRLEQQSADDIEITDAEHAALFAAIAAAPAPKIIARGADGRPAVQNLPPPADEQLADAARARRDALITATDYLLMPDYPISAGQLAEVRAYRQALRDVPLQQGFPQAIDWPEPPTITTE